MKLETLKIEASKRAIGPQWGYEMQQPMKPMHGLDIEREIECLLSPVIGPMKWKRVDDEGGIIRRLFG